MKSVFSQRFSWEKSARLLQWLVFSWLTLEWTLFVWFVQLNDRLGKTSKLMPKDSNVAYKTRQDRKVLLFFGHVWRFFRKVFNVSEGVLSMFLILCNKLDVFYFLNFSLSLINKKGPCEAKLDVWKARTFLFPLLHFLALHCCFKNLFCLKWGFSNICSARIYFFQYCPNIWRYFVAFQ